MLEQQLFPIDCDAVPYDVKIIIPPRVLGALPPWDGEQQNLFPCDNPETKSISEVPDWTHEGLQAAATAIQWLLRINPAPDCEIHVHALPPKPKTRKKEPTRFCVDSVWVRLPEGAWERCGSSAMLFHLPQRMRCCAKLPHVRWRFDWQKAGGSKALSMLVQAEFSRRRDDGGNVTPWSRRQFRRACKQIERALEQGGNRLKIGWRKLARLVRLDIACDVISKRSELELLDDAKPSNDRLFDVRYKNSYYRQRMKLTPGDGWTVGDCATPNPYSPDGILCTYDKGLQLAEHGAVIPVVLHAGERLMRLEIRLRGNKVIERKTGLCVLDDLRRLRNPEGAFRKACGWKACAAGVAGAGAGSKKACAAAGAAAGAACGRVDGAGAVRQEGGKEGCETTSAFRALTIGAQIIVIKGRGPPVSGAESPCVADRLQTERCRRTPAPAVDLCLVLRSGC